MISRFKIQNIIYAIMFVLWISLAGCGSKSSLSGLTLSSYASPPQTVAININNYKPQGGNSLQNLFVSNFSVKAVNGQLQLSSAADGLSDTTKTSTFGQYGFSIINSESIVTGFADLILYNAGILQSSYAQISCSPAKTASTSNDMIIYNDSRYTGSPTRTLGLRDCEKSYLGLNPSLFDYNKNGIPDYLELRCGMNPQNASVAFTSTAGDNIANIDKCKQHIPLDENAFTQANQLFAYQYSQNVNSDGSFNFVINNIPILEAGANNLIAFYVTEVNQTTGTSSLYTAYAVLKSGYNGKTLQFNYWATSASKFTNQPVIVP